MKQKIILSAGIIPVRDTHEGARYLLLRVYSYWDFPKGMVEGNEDPLQGAVRELREETAIKDVVFEWGREFRETPPYGKGKIARYYLGRVEESAVRLSFEHHEYRWASFEEARHLLAKRVQPILDWARDRIERQ